MLNINVINWMYQQILAQYYILHDRSSKNRWNQYNNNDFLEGEIIHIILLK